MDDLNAVLLKIKAKNDELAPRLAEQHLAVKLFHEAAEAVGKMSLMLSEEDFLDIMRAAFGERSVVVNVQKGRKPSGVESLGKLNFGRQPGKEEIMYAKGRGMFEADLCLSGLGNDAKLVLYYFQHEGPVYRNRNFGAQDQGQ